MIDGSTMNWSRGITRIVAAAASYITLTAHGDCIWMGIMSNASREGFVQSHLCGLAASATPRQWWERWSEKIHMALVYISCLVLIASVPRQIPPVLILSVWPLLGQQTHSDSTGTYWHCNYVFHFMTFFFISYNEWSLTITRACLLVTGLTDLAVTSVLFSSVFKENAGGTSSFNRRCGTNSTESVSHQCPTGYRSQQGFSVLLGHYIWLAKQRT